MASPNALIDNALIDRSLPATTPMPPEPDGVTLATLSDWLHAHARVRPDALAIETDSGTRLSWGELTRRAHGLAEQLAGRGVGPGGLVGVCMDRSVDLIVAFWGILLAGGAYVPLDPTLPRGRLALLVEDAGIDLVLAHAPTGGLAPARRELLVEALATPTASTNALACPPGPVERSAAYVIYTSGTTGRPKGVVVEHRGAVALVRALAAAFSVDETSRILQVSSLAFDASLFELLLALAAGASLQLASARSLDPGPDLVATLRARAITHVTLVPSVLATLPPLDVPSLGVLVVAGEPCPPDVVRRFGQGRRLINAYGPTEGTICATAFDTGAMAAGGWPPIGRPLDGVAVRLLDAALRPVADGAIGELHIGGPTVARGYLGQRALTAERFVPDPEGAPGARRYRTGDLARRLPDGNLEFAGRADEQVKIRGVRVELGEVEATLRACPGVREAAAAVREDPSGQRRLIAWVVAEPDAPAAATEDAGPARWRAFLRERLAEAMVPATFVPLAALPRAPSGKVDRRALPAPPAARPAAAGPFIAPTTAAEQRLAALWASALGIAPIGLDDDWFALGGDSLGAVRLLATARDAFGVELGATALFAAPTVRAMIQSIASAAQAASPIPSVPRDPPPPLSSAQYRLWFLAQLDPASTAYHLPLLLRIDGPLDVARLERALAELVERYEALRTVFPSVGGTPVQRVLPAACWPLRLACDDLSDIAEDQREPRLLATLRAALRRPFDLARGPLLRPHLFRLAPGPAAASHALALCMPHIVVDGWSAGLLVRALTALYDGDTPAAPRLTPIDLAVHEQRALAAGTFDDLRAFWASTLAGAGERLPLPADHPRPAVRSAEGARHAIALAAPIARGLAALGRAHGATPFMSLLAVFAALLHARTGARDLVVGTPVSNRDRHEAEAVVGFLANTLPLRLRWDGDPSFRALLAMARRAVLAAFAHRQLPFEHIVAAAGPARSQDLHPLFQHLFVLQEMPVTTTARDGVRFHLDDPDTGTTPFDLTIELWPTPDGSYSGAVRYATDLFDAATIQRLTDDFADLAQRATTDPDAPLARLLAPLQLQDQTEMARLGDVLAADPDVLDSAIRFCTAADQTRRLVAWVVPAAYVAPARLLTSIGPAGQLAGGTPVRVIPVAALPLDPEGALDLEALARLPALDDRVGDRTARTADHARVIETRLDPPPRLHLNDLVPPRPQQDSAPLLPAHRSTRLAQLDGGPLIIPDGAPDTLGAALLATAARHPAHELRWVETARATSIQSYRTLRDEALALLAGLREHGLAPGDRVLLHLDTLREHYTAFWACVLGGLVPVSVGVAPSYEQRNAAVDKLHHVWSRLRPTLLTSAALLGPLHALGTLLPMPDARILAVDTLRRPGAIQEPHPARPDDIAFLQLSSGSTGAVKLIPETHRAVVRHVHALAQYKGYSASDVTLAWLPPDHVASLLMCHVKDVFLGCRQIHARTDLVLGDPLLLFDLIDAHRATDLLSPNFGYKLLLDALERAPERSWDLSSLRRIANGAEQVTLPVTREFLRRAALFGLDPRAMSPGFGMAESASAVTFDRDFSLDTGVFHVVKRSLDGPLAFSPTEGDDTTPLISLGGPVPGVALRIVDGAGAVLPEAVIGRLQLRGGVIMPGYLDDEPANRDAFTADGWFDTGDLGFIADGRLALTGRGRETLIIRGSKIYAHEVEDIAEEVPGVAPASLAACAIADAEGGTEALALFFVPRPDADPVALAAALRAHLTRRLGVTPRYLLPLAAHELPRTASGKLQRGELRARLVQGAFREAIGRMELALGDDAHTLPACFFARTFRRRAIAPGPLPAGWTLLVIDDDALACAIADALTAAGRGAVRVCRQPHERSDTSASVYLSDPTDDAAWSRLLDERAPADARLPATILYAPAADTRAAASEADPDATELLTLGALLRACDRHVTRAAGAQPATPLPPVRLRLIDRGAQSVLADDDVDPRRALLVGVAETLARELSWLDVRHVDLDTSAPAAAARAILDEISAPKGEREAAWRDGVRWVMGLESVRPAPRADHDLPGGGVWLLAGGAGGVGGQLARFLLETHGARLLLVGRTAREALATDAAQALRALEALATQKGGAVAYAAADITDLAAVERVAAAAELRWGRPLDGILHLAGTLAERLFLEQDAAYLANAIAAKVTGTIALDRLAAARPACTLMVLASVTASVGGFATSAYAAACRFQEHFVHQRRRTGGRCRVVSFGAWRDVGMSRGRIRPDAGALPAAKAVVAFRAALLDGRDLLVGLDPLSREVRRRLHRAAPLLEMADPAAPPPAMPDRPASPDHFGALEDTRMTGSPAAERDLPAAAPTASGAGGATRERVAAIWRDVLRRDAVAPHDNFFDLGGHSLLLVQVRARLQTAFSRDIAMMELFRHPTIAALAAWLDGHDPAAHHAPAALAPAASTAETRVAIIGVALRLPGAADADTFFRNLCDGVEGVRWLADPASTPTASAGPLHGHALLDDVAGLDAGFFGFSPREAELTDPQQRLFLECAWEALERAGYDAERFPGAIGVFAGAGREGYLLHHLAPNPAVMATLGAMSTVIGNDKDHLSLRVAYKLDLRGPAVTVQTACSTSLVAVHWACRELNDGRCDMALAGGVSIAFPLGATDVHQETHILSPDGHCRPFDAAASGTVGGDGAAVVVLKRLDRALADGDFIHAVVLGSAVNNDGAHKVGYTAPSASGQARVIAAAHAAAGVAPASIGYIEAHGTGTALGDPIEVAALTQAFAAGDARSRRSCALGSLKGNLGHLNTAAGVAGLIKAALVVEHGVVPPTLHFRTPNPAIDFDAGPFFVAATAQPFPAGTGPRRAGVSAFGFGGTNAHAIVEQPPALAPRPQPQEHRPRLFVLSARTAAALTAASTHLAAHLAQRPALDPDDVSFTLLAGRRRFAHRRAWVARSHEDYRAVLARAPLCAAVAEGVAPQVAFLFPGQGTPCAGVAARLYRSAPGFRTILDRGAVLLLDTLGVDLRDVLLAEGAGHAEATERLAQTAIAQPALFLLEYALATLWMSFGVQPAAALGHSLGEYACACLAGVMGFEDALGLVAERGRLMQAMPAGAMLSVALDEAAARALTGPAVALAAVNAPTSCVLAGPVPEIEALARQLDTRGVSSTRLATTRAFHAPAMDPVLAPFIEAVRRVALRPPRIPFLSCLTGTWITDDQAVDPAYWARQLRAAVRFADGVAELLRTDQRLLLDLGPGRTVSALAQRHPGAAGRVLSAMPAARQPADERDALLEAAARLWTAGVPLDERGLYAGEPRRRVPLPTYPFERQRYFVDAPDARVTAAPRARPAVVERMEWQPRPAPKATPLAGRTLVLCSDGAASATEQAVAPTALLIDALRRSDVALLIVHAASRGSAPHPDDRVLDPADTDAWAALFESLRADDRAPERIVWLAPCDPAALGSFARAVARRLFRARLDLTIIGRYALLDTAAPGAALAGAVEALASELPDLRARLIDIDPAADAVATALAAELAASDPLVVLRGHERLVPARHTPGAAPASPLDTVVVFEGASGLALTAAEALQRQDARVALILSPTLPPPSSQAQSAAHREHAGALDLHALAATEHALGEALAVRPIGDYPGLREGLDALCTAWIVRWLRSSGIDLALGATYTPAALSQRLGVTTKFTRMLDALLGFLVEDGVLQRTGETLRVTRDGATLPDPEALHRRLSDEHPGFAGLLQLISHCARTYRDSLTGRIDAISVLYPGGSAQLVEDCERRTVAHRSDRRCLLLLREVARRLASAAGRPLRVLEVGGGQGLLTWPLLAALEPFGVTLHFTDLGKAFVDDARREAARRGLAEHVRCDVLDLARPASEQGFAAGAYDLIAGYNVVHATPDVPFVLRNLAPLLAPGGTLALVEVVETTRWDTLTWGLAEGWWYWADDVRSNGPLLDLATWERVLLHAGYLDPIALPRGEPARAHSDHGLILARAPGPTIETPDATRQRRLAALEQRGVPLIPHDPARPPAVVIEEAQSALAVPRAIDARKLDAILVDPDPTAAAALLSASALTTAPATWPSLFDAHRARLRAIDEALADRPALPRLALLPARGPAGAAPLRRSCEAFAAQARAAGRAWTAVSVAPGVLADALPAALAQAARAGAAALIVRAPAPQTSATPALPATPRDVAATLAAGPRVPPNGAGASSTSTPHTRPSLETPYLAPRTPLQAQIAAVVSDLLGVDRIGVHDDFIALGADSLIMLRITDRLARELGRPIPPEAAFRGATVERLAQALGDPGPRPAAGAADMTPLVAIQPAGNRPPLFFVHPATGVVFPYFQLARALGPEQPFYALQALGLDGLAPRDTRIEDMARHYIAAIRAVQPRGPYHLGGFSFGSLVAYEMAVQLHDAGEPPGLVALLDEPAPIDMYRPTLWLMLKLFIDGGVLDLLPYLGDHLALRRGPRGEHHPGRPASGSARTPVKDLADRFAIAADLLEELRANRSAGAILQRLAARATLAPLFPPEQRPIALRQPALLKLFDFFRLHGRMTFAYQPRAYPHKVTLLKATDLSGRAGYDPTQGWRMLAAGGVDVVRVPGTHMTLLRQPHVLTAARLLTRALNAALRADDAPSAAAGSPERPPPHPR